MNAVDNFRKLGFVALISVSLALVGCGGGGKKGSSGSISLSSSKTTIEYGESVSINWSSSGIDHMDAYTNFPISGNQLSGSISDVPAADTTYVIRGIDLNGNPVTKSRTVKVNKSLKTIMVLGDPATAGVPQIAQTLQTLTIEPVTVSSSMPSLVGVNALVLLPSAAYTESDKATVAIYLASGGSVVLVDQAPLRLAIGDWGTGDVSAIGSWCAGATGQVFWLGTEEAVSVNPTIPFSATLYGDGIADAYNLTPVAGNAIRLTTGINGSYAAFVYTPLSGGKVGFVGAAGIGSSSGDLTVKGILLSEVRWAVDGL